MIKKFLNKIPNNIAYLIVTIVIINFLFSLLYLDNWGHDDGYYAYIGREILNGAVLYKDIFHIDTPATVYLYAFSFLLFGQNEIAVMILTLIIKSLIVLTIFYLAKYIFNKKIAIISSVFMLLALYIPGIGGYSNALNNDMGVILFNTLGLLFFLKFRQTQNYKFLGLSGLLIGIAFLFKQTAVFVLLAIAIYYFCELIFSQGNKKFLKRVILDISILTIIALAPLVVTIVYFSNRGALNDLIFSIFIFPLKYYRNIYNYSLQEVLKHYLTIGISNAFIWLLALSGSIRTLYQFLKEKILTPAFLLTVWFFCLLPLAFSNLFGQYFLALMPSASILASWVFLSLRKEFRQSDLLFSRILILSILILTLVFSTVYNCLSYHGLKNNTDIKIETYKKVAHFLSNRLKSGEQIYVLFFEPEIYFFTNTKSPTKNLSLWGMPNETSYILNALDDINYVIIKGEKPLFKNAALTNETELIYNYIYIHYSQIITINNFKIYKREWF